MTQYNVIVIGSNCFSGSHFIHGLLTDNAQVLGINRSSEQNDILLPHKHHPNYNNYRFAQLHVNNNMLEICNIIQQFKPQYVVNFAAQGMVAESWKDPKQWFQTNLMSQIELHEFLRTQSYLQKYVQISTPEVYGTTNGLIKENTNYQPSTPYAVSKASTDMSLMSYRHAYDFPVVFTRAANVYGPSQQLYRIIPRTVLCVLLGKRLQLHGGGVSSRSFVHIKDVVRGTIQIMKDAKPGSIYHIGTDEIISIRHLVQTITDMMGVCFEDHVDVMEEDRLGKDMEYTLDWNKIHTEFGWKPTYNLQQGLEETIAWIKDNLSVLQTLEMDYIHKL